MPLLYCDDAVGGACTGDPDDAALELCLNPGETVYILIDGYGVQSQGTAQLLINNLGTCAPPAPAGF